MRLTFPIPDLVQLQFPPRTRDRLSGSPCDTQRGRISGERGGSGGEGPGRGARVRAGAGGGKGDKTGREGPSGSGPGAPIGIGGAHLPQELIDGVFRLRRLADAVPEVTHDLLLSLEHYFSPFSPNSPFSPFVSAKGFFSVRL